MAIIKAVNSKASIGKAIKYVTKGEKTQEILISGKDCSPHTAIDEMKATKELWGKTEGRQYTNLVQSFNPEDKITPQQAHEIGLKFIENNEKFKGHEVVISTHVDKGHIHNHFIVNSVNYENGKKLHTNKNDLKMFKELSNELSKEHGLTVPTRGESITTFSQNKYKAIQKGFMEKEKSYLLDTAKEVSNSLKKVTSKENFIKDMESKGYKVNWSDTRKYITFTTPEGKKVRNSNLEKTFKEQKFSKEGMEYEIQRNREQRVSEGRRKESVPGLDERNQRTEQINAELHKSTHESGFSNSNDTRPRTEQDREEKPRDTRENGIDIAKAREQSERLRHQAASTYGKWQKRNEPEQSNDPRENGSDRENSKKEPGRNEPEHKKQYARTRSKDFHIGE